MSARHAAGEQSLFVERSAEVLRSKRVVVKRTVLCVWLNNFRLFTFHWRRLNAGTVTWNSGGLRRVEIGWWLSLNNLDLCDRLLAARLRSLLIRLAFGIFQTRLMASPDE